jgi:hypothetical protein
LCRTLTRVFTTAIFTNACRDDTHMRKAAAQAAPKSNDDIDLGSFEGKYPKHLFNKTFVIDNQTIGHVTKETEDVVVVFSESDKNIRYDIPKSQIVSMGGSVTIRDTTILESFMRDRDSPLPEDKTSLRPTAEEIRSLGKAPAQEQKEVHHNHSRNSAEAVLQEREELIEAPRDTTRTVSEPEGYDEMRESEITRQLKRAISEFKDLFYAGSKVAKKKMKEKKRLMDKKQAEMDAARIAHMGDLATQFANDYDRILAEIRARPVSEQAKMYDGLITLMDFQRKLAIARRDLAAKVEGVVRESAGQDS